MAQVSVGSGKNWYFLARQEKFIQGINSVLAPDPLPVIHPHYLISKPRPRVPPGSSSSFHSWKTRDLHLHSRKTHTVLPTAGHGCSAGSLTLLCHLERRESAHSQVPRVTNHLKTRSGIENAEEVGGDWRVPRAGAGSGVPPPWCHPPCPAHAAPRSPHSASAFMWKAVLSTQTTAEWADPLL